MKCRVFKTSNGGVRYDWPSKEYQEKIEACRIPNALKDLPYIVIDEFELPSLNSKNGDCFEMLYFNGECKKENLKQDKEWKVCLMPPFLIKKKHLVRCNSKLDEELAKESPDPIKIAKIQREKEKCSTWSEKQWYEQAKTYIIDENIDKPLILEKLNQKIEEFS